MHRHLLAIFRGGVVWRRWLSFAAVLALLWPSLPGLAATWDPESFGKHDVVTLRTNCQPEGEYSFPVWVVAISGHLYVRLGTRAANRVECTPGMTIGVEVAGQRFENVHVVPSQDMAARVASEMAEKYPTDLLLRWLSHPLTARLEP